MHEELDEAEDHLDSALQQEYKLTYRLHTPKSLR